MSFQRESPRDLARLLARSAESVCRHYLPNGRREGSYWLAGDVGGAPGRSLFVRLRGPESGKGAAGKWTDAATGEHGDLLDLIRARCGLASFRETAAEARRFLALPQEPITHTSVWQATAAPGDRIEAARRLFAMARPIPGTIAEAYLRSRGIADHGVLPALRFHPACYCRLPDGSTLGLPALIAAATDARGRIMGVQRTWLSTDGSGKASMTAPRRAMGALLGHGVRFGFAPGNPADVIAAGEGIETMLSLRMLMPSLPVIAALSAAHLGALVLPDSVRRLYVAADADGAGRAGTVRIASHARQAGIETLTLRSALGDFNDDLRGGRDALRLLLLRQLAPGDAERFISDPVEPPLAGTLGYTAKG